MKLLFFCNLFLICINAFTIQPSIPFLSKSYKNIQSHSSIFINNNNFHITMIKNKKNNNDDNYLNEEETKKLYNIIIKNIIFYIYVYVLIYKLQHLH
jgi:hypothetical protein